MSRAAAWLLALLLGAVPPAVAGDEEDDEQQAEQVPPLEECLELLGRGGEWEALGERHAAAHPQPDLQRVALAFVSSETAPWRVIGGAAWLGRPVPGARPDRAARLLERRLKQRGLTPALQAALVEALGAVSGPAEAAQLGEQLAGAPEPEAAAAARGLARSWCAAEPLLQVVGRLRATLVATEGEDAGPAAQRLRLALGAVRDLAASPRGATVVEVVSRDPAAAPPEVLPLLAGVRTQEACVAARDLGRAMLADRDGPTHTRAVALSLLALVRPLEAEDVERVIDALVDPVPGVRIAAARQVQPLQLRAALPALVAMLEDADGAVVAAAHAELCRWAGLQIPALKPAWERWLQTLPEEEPAGE